MLFSLAVTEGIGFGNGWSSKIDFIDISRAYFDAKARRPLYVKLPNEDHEQGMVGRLNKAMYGTRDAVQTWEYEFHDFMTSIGFTASKTSPCVFYHAKKS